MHRLSGKEYRKRSSTHEYFHNPVRDSVDRLDLGLGCVSRGRWLDSPSADRGPDFASSAFRQGPKRRLDYVGLPRNSRRSCRICRLNFTRSRVG